MITQVSASQVPDSLPRTPNYALFSYDDRVYFSATEQGDAITMHIAAEGRQGKLALRKAVDEFCDYIFDSCPQCPIILGAVGPQSVVNLATNCGFTVLGKRRGDINGKMRDVTLVGRARQ